MNSPKYNRTFHLPWSPGATNDDKIATDTHYLIKCPIVITEKMDGSNTSLEHDGCFARTHAGPPTHKSFDGLKALHSQLVHDIPVNFQLFGEWCYAQHSIAYDKLPGYFLLFGIREIEAPGGNYWYSWEDVEMFADYFGVPTVPVLFKGEVSSEKELKELVESLMKQPSVCGGIREGVVVRVQDSFTDESFPNCVMKCVRANHVQTSEHWKDQEIIKNKLVSP
jgi:ATP-dependent RNA circularization protein (DNA/RNA ligase family)